MLVNSRKKKQTNEFSLAGSSKQIAKNLFWRALSKNKKNKQFDLI